MKSGAPLPCPIYGTAWKAARTEDLVVKAVLSGFRSIDTACQPKHYNEAGVGSAVRILAEKGIARDALFLQTKFTPLDGQDPLRLPYESRAPLAEQIAQSFASSQRNLGTDYVDSLVLHSPLKTFAQTMDAWRAMEKIHRNGGALRLGISNCYDLEVLKRLSADAAVKPSILQNRFYQDTGYDKPLRAWGRTNGIVYQSFWTLSANPHVLEHPVFEAVAQKYGKTPASILFRFLTQQGAVPLTGTCSERHMKESLDIFSFELSKESVSKIETLLASGQ